ncbi:hypothetical protein [Mycolicibacterium sphagni]|uniref:hypothetical protein n=1 Tax=Mycolicibacterium sphagni TaxID=1786 RepID=UPI0021F352C7|nr:hypothetical protein [Mycolicibacterium sphagni]MCV7174950.1 hypothetical protein [Mycolicibacterium sphagni]
MDVVVEVDRQGLTTGLRALAVKPGDLHLGRQLADGTIILEPARIVRICDLD